MRFSDTSVKSWFGTFLRPDLVLETLVEDAVDVDDALVPRVALLPLRVRQNLAHQRVDVGLLDQVILGGFDYVGLSSFISLGCLGTLSRSKRALNM